jgi:biopolymer transport protein TolR
MKFSSSEDEAMLSEINVTPMVDVMLVLLVIFMVTAPLIQQGIPVNLPKSDASQALSRDDKDIILSITKSRKLLLDRYEVEVSSLKPKLDELFRNRSEKKIYIKADREVEYGYVVEVMGTVKAAGIDRIGMITDQSALPAKGK